jgi:hypothetical protein
MVQAFNYEKKFLKNGAFIKKMILSKEFDL